jgi:uncharacterized protein YqcC (DUF446 family)
MAADYDVVATKTDEIEAEIRRVRMWQDKPLPAEAMNFQRAFGGDTMAFEQWLQFVFIPRVRSIIESRGKFPSQSEVAGQAFKEWRMWGDAQNADDLLRLLKGFDGLFS